MSETTAYSNHIKMYELETRECLDQETENIPRTLQTDLVTSLNDNPLTISMDSSKHEERHKPEVNPDPEPSSSYLSLEKFLLDTRAKKEKHKKNKKRRMHQKYDSSDPYFRNDSDS